MIEQRRVEHGQEQAKYGKVAHLNGVNPLQREELGEKTDGGSEHNTTSCRKPDEVHGVRGRGPHMLTLPDRAQIRDRGGGALWNCLFYWGLNSMSYSEVVGYQYHHIKIQSLMAIMQ